MKAVYILLVLLIAALISGCVDKKEQNITSSTPADFQNISSSTSAEILPENYVSEVEGNFLRGISSGMTTQSGRRGGLRGRC